MPSQENHGRSKLYALLIQNFKVDGLTHLRRGPLQQVQDYRYVRAPHSLHAVVVMLCVRAHSKANRSNLPNAAREREGERETEGGRGVGVDEAGCR